MSLPLPEQVPRNRSASTGDSGLPKHEHKRPRLSGGLSDGMGDNQLTLSASNTDNDPHSTTQTLAPSPAASTLATSALASPPLSPLPNAEIPDVTSPQSKVTINTRPISSQSSTTYVQKESSNGVMNSVNPNPPTLSDSRASTPSHPDKQSEPISISSSDSGSPIIQVALPEDLDQDPTDTQWEPISATSSPQRLSIRLGHVQRTFPYLNHSNNTSVQNIIPQIARAFTEGTGSDDEVFRNVKTWVVEFSRNATALRYEFFQEDHEFWTRFPTLVSGLLKRKVPLPTGVQVDDLVEFFLAFVHITGLVIEADTGKLRTCLDVLDSKTIINIYSLPFLPQLQWMLISERIPLYDMMQDSLFSNSTAVVDEIMGQMQKSHAVKHIESLSTLFETITNLFPKRMAFIEPALSIIVHVGAFISMVANQVTTLSAESESARSCSEAILSTSSQFLQSIDAVLDRAITKQQSWLSIETCEKVFKAIGDFVAVVVSKYPNLAVDLLLAANIQPSHFGDTELVTLAPIAWRFSGLQKCIKKGRMEVRVASVQSMARELVEVYNDHIISTSRGTEHPLVQFMIQFIRENDMIRYIIGVDSHPQIIERSSHIIGFLCVSHSYRNEDTDIIWQTVLESQDPRAVVALLGAFQPNLDNLSLFVLQYIVRKLLTLPYERVDTNMLEFATKLVNAVEMKTTRDLYNSKDVLETNECILRFCTKLLREANTPEHISTEFSARIRQQIQPMLDLKITLMRRRSRLGNDVNFLHNILGELCNDIRLHNDFASGSALAFSIILTDADDEECASIVQGHDLAALLVEDIVQACRTVLTSYLKDSVWVELDNRLALLMKLISRTSHLMTETLIEDLWTNLLSNSMLNLQLRSVAWKLLGDVFPSCRVRNEMLDTVVNRYLPILPPTLYDAAVLGFVQQSVKYEIRHTPAELMEPQEIITIPGIERVWSIMLNALPNTVETPASEFIIKQYVGNGGAEKRHASSMEATHLLLIDRCVKQVIDAASHLKVTSDADMSDNIAGPQPENSNSNIEFYTLRFHRSLLFLRKFLDSLKANPHYTPAVNDNLRETLKTFDSKGQTFEVTLQIIGHKKLANVQLKWLLGHDNSGAEVWQFLSEITGWSLFTVITGGKRLLLKDEQKSLQELGIRTGSFMISKVQGSPETTPAREIRASSPVDRKVMHHFDALYNLLELDNQFAKEVFDFLGMFSSQEKVVRRLRALTDAPEQLLPVEKPFKLMYYAKALRSCIEEESYSAEPDTDFLVYSISTILSTLPRLGKLKAEASTHMSIAQGLVEALNLGFRAKVATEISSTYINDGASFNRDIIALWSQALDVNVSAMDSTKPAQLAKSSFEALVEGWLHVESLWSMVPIADLKSCLERSLLVQNSQELRQSTLSVIHALTGVSNSKLTTKNNESRSPRTRFQIETVDTCLMHLWKVLIMMVQQADSAAAECEEYFDALLSIFRQYHKKLTEAELSHYVEEWKYLLLAHRHVQQVGLPSEDFFVGAIGKLLLQAIKAIQRFKSLDTDTSFVQDIFATFLFPPLSDALSFDANIIQQQNNPVLDMHSRWVLYELLVALSAVRGNLDAVCDEMSSDLVPKDFCLQPLINNDRQSLRSEVGYSGLRNLSNTCYLNSLISQLFMNVDFRELVMDVNIIDLTKQRLVAELGKLFAYMQTSYEEAVSPESAIEAVTLWDGDQIDVTVQMDVDEFFNLLFDRLESQIIDPKICSAFKSIYGGQLVQQIKSKECEHVSERLEPFTAVQVEIKGKATLEESLRAYVEGEVLQGENKYSCTGCGKHVDAVKRACLKTVPNHLIFNLKRFDFDIMTGMRCKVNDEFGFPANIDMMPYTMDALAKPEEVIEQDIFELVGVIIHSGTAESGHYYSYIRQRPSDTSVEKSWFQFNDHDVSRFDPSSIKECCFGGVDYGAIQCPKFYNGYMLFYQRSSSIREIENKFLSSKASSPVRLPLVPALETHISQHNELFLRSYVAQDPVHARFVKSLLQQKAVNDDLRCVHGHEETTSKLLVMALDYISQTSARWKDLPEVEETLSLLRNYVTECDACARLVITWLTDGDNLMDNLVRSCYAAVRTGFANLIAICLQKWSATLHEYQRAPQDQDSIGFRKDHLEDLRKFLITMIDGWDHLQRHGRAWELYFSIIQLLLRAGDEESRLVIEAGFLQHTLELVHVHVLSLACPKRLRVKYGSYLLQRERNRPFAHGPLIQLLADLLQRVDLAAPFNAQGDVSPSDDPATPTAIEAYWLGITQQPPNLTWLRKVILGRANPLVADKIVACLCATKQFDRLLSNMLRDGLAETNLLWATACLHPTLVFISTCTLFDVVIEVVEEALALIETTNGQYGKEFLTFVHELCSASNPVASFARGGLMPYVKKYVPKWVPVLLMAPNEMHTDVRSETFELLNEVLFQRMDGLRQTDNRKYRQDVATCKSLAKNCAGYAETAFINARAPVIHAGQANEASTVVNHCLRFFGENASDEDEAARISGTMEDFRIRAEGVVETTTEADWNASSDLEAMSEVDNMSDTSN